MARYRKVAGLFFCNFLGLVAWVHCIKITVHMAIDANAARERAKQESVAGQKAARKLTGDLRQKANQFKTRSGSLKNISATKRMRNGQLRAIAIKGPKHAYIQHYGFLGTKSNGVFQRLKATNFIVDAIGAGSIDKLATEISEIRAEEIVANIKIGR